MKYNYPVFTRSLLTSVFAGIVATVVCLFFDVFYREGTNYHPADLINVSSLIFGVNLIFAVIGAIYYFFVRSGKSAEIAFIVIFFALTALCIWKVTGANMWPDAKENSEYRTLFSAIIGIMGICAFVLIPFFYHSKKFEEAVV